MKMNCVYAKEERPFGRSSLIYKRITAFILSIVVMLSMIPAGFASDLTSIQICEQNKSEALEITQPATTYDYPVYMVKTDSTATGITVSDIQDVAVNDVLPDSAVPQWLTLDVVAKMNTLDPESNGYEDWETLVADYGYATKEDYLTDYGIECDNPPFYGLMVFSSSDYVNGAYNIALTSQLLQSQKSIQSYFPQLTYDDTANYYLIKISEFVTEETAIETGALTEDIAAILVQSGGTSEVAVDKSELNSAINSVSEEGFYISDDRYNGKSTSENGFWSDVQTALSEAQAINNSTSATQDQVDTATENLTAAIANLIPATKVNPTALYETLNAKNYWDNDGKLVQNPSYVHASYAVPSADNCTASTWSAYAAAVAEGQELLDSLYYQEGDYIPDGKTVGDATAANTSAKQTEVERLAAAADPHTLVNANVYSNAYSTYRSRKEEASSLLSLYDPEKLTESDYTETTWQAYTEAYDALKADLAYTIVGGTKADMEMLDGFVGHINALKTARQKLTSNVAITVNFHYVNNFSAKFPQIRESGTEVYENAALALDASSTTAQGALTAAGIIFDTKDFVNNVSNFPLGYQNLSDTNPLIAAYINGESYGLHDLNSEELANIQLHQGDKVRLVRVCTPTVKVEASSGYDSTTITDGFAYDETEYQDSYAVIDMTVPTGTVKVGDKAAFSAAVTGANATNMGGRMDAENITLFVSEPSGTETLSSPAKQTTAVTDSSGALTYVFTEPGWYTVAMYNVQDNVPTFTDVYNAITYGTYYDLYAGDFALVHVAEADNESAVIAQYQSEYRAQAKAYFEQFHDYDFAAGYYDGTFKAQYDTLTANIDAAATFKALKEQYDADFAKLQEYGAAAIDHESAISALLDDLAIVSDLDLGTLDTSYRDLLTSIQTAYSGLNTHQRSMLTGVETARLNEIAAFDVDTLIELPEVLVKVVEEADVTAAHKLGYHEPGGATYYGWADIDWAMYPNTDGMVSNPRWDKLDLFPADGETVTAGSYVYARRYLNTTDEAYRMAWSVDGETWNLSTPQTYNSGGSSYGDYYLAEYQIPKTMAAGSEVTITLKMLSKAEYDALSSNPDDLTAAKESAIAALQATYDGYDMSRYDDTGKAALQKALDDGIAAINAATNNTAVAEARRAAVAAMAAVQRIASTTPGTVTPNYDSGDAVGQVRVIVENTTYSASPLSGTLVDNWYTLGKNDSMMTCILKALRTAGYSWNGTVDFGDESEADYSITYISAITKGENTLAEFTGGQKSGWMGTLNDWFTNEGFAAFTYANGKLENGDVIRVMYTTDYGEDIGGSWNNSDTSLKALSVNGATLVPSFDGSVKDYTLLISSERANLTVLPEAANKNYQVKTFLNNYNVNSAYYKSTDTISVTSGDTVYVGVGESGWLTMNSSSNGTKYTLKVNNLASTLQQLPTDSQVNFSNYKTYQTMAQQLRENIRAQGYTGDVSALERLEARVTFFEQIDHVKDLLNAIPASGWTASDATAVRAARSAYDALSDEQKLYITVGDVAKFNAAVEWLESQKIDTGGSGGSITGSSSMPGEVVEEKEVSVTIEPSATVSGSKATASVTAAQVSDAIKAAETENANTIVIAPSDTGSATSVAVELPKTAAQAIVDDTSAALSVQTAVGTVTIPNDVLSSIASQAGGSTIEIVIEKKAAADVKDKVDAETLENALVTEVTVRSNGKDITSFGGKSLTIDLPADSKLHTSGKSYKVIVLSSDGTTQTIYGKCQTVNGKLVVRISIDHLSTFILTGMESMPFTDVSTHWALEAIQYAYDNGLMAGTSDTIFAPDGTLNRAMLVTILYRMEGEPAVTAANPFADVAAGQWYTNAVVWANESGVANGVGADRFAPTTSITREQLATMLYNYAKYKGKDVSKANDLAAFTDASAVSAWALDAVKWANAEGLVSGRTTTTIVPGGTATRAEAASILMRFLQNT